MSSLAASRADGYYHPPDYDPAKHGSLNQFRGQHPLRERAKKLDQGILVIRFEMPFNVWCEGCSHLIGKGVRFNAEKKQIGNYHSTKIWSFTMRAPCCGQEIEVQTDPKNTEYEVVKGGRRKVETWTAENAETLELPDKEEEAFAPPPDDPFTRLERGETDKQKGRQLSARVVELYHDSDLKFRDDYDLNKLLRRQNRAQRKQEKEREVKRKSLGLSEDVKLLPVSAEDSFAASLVQFGDPAAFTKKWQQRRRDIKAQSIFLPSAVAKPSHTAAPVQSTAGRQRSEKIVADVSAAAGAAGLGGKGTDAQRPSKRHRPGLQPIVEEAEEDARSCPNPSALKHTAGVERDFQGERSLLVTERNEQETAPPLRAHTARTAHSHSQSFGCDHRQGHVVAAVGSKSQSGAFARNSLGGLVQKPSAPRKRSIKDMAASALRQQVRHPRLRT